MRKITTHPSPSFHTSPAAQEPAVIRPSNRPPSIWHRLLRFMLWAIALGSFLVVGLLLGVGLYFGWEWRQANKILPGITAMEVSLGGLTPAEAAAKLQNRWQSEPLVIAFPDQNLPAVPGDIGLQLHTDGMAQQAAGLTRANDWGTVIDFMLNDRTIEPLISLDQSAARDAITEIKQVLTVTPLDAGIAWENGRFVETAAQAGQTVDVEATLQAWTITAATYQPGRPFELVMMTLDPQITTTAELVNTLNSRLDIPLSLSLFDPISGSRQELTVPSALWGGWIAPRIAGADNITWQIDDRALEGDLTQLATQAQLADYQYLDPAAAVSGLRTLLNAHLNQETAAPLTLRVYYGERLHTVQAGETFSSIARAYGFPYPWLQAANPGIDGLSIGQTITIPSPDAMLPLPIVENKRIEISLSQQRLWAYENGVLKWEWAISTGIESSPTSPGIFQVQTHEESAYAGNWDLDMPYFMGIYQPVPNNPFMNGFHGFPTRGGSQLLWTNSIGTPVTYGCILVDNAVVQSLYSWAEEGVVVAIRN